MYTNILIPTDGSELAGKGVVHGIALANQIGARLTVLTVTRPFHVLTTDTRMIEDTEDEYQTRMRIHAEKVLGGAADIARVAGVSCELIHIVHERPHEAIIETVGSKLCDLVVMASHGHGGFSAIVLGSETIKVLTHSNVPVLVYR